MAAETVEAEETTQEETVPAAEDPEDAEKTENTAETEAEKETEEAETAENEADVSKEADDAETDEADESTETSDEEQEEETAEDHDAEAVEETDRSDAPVEEAEPVKKSRQITLTAKRRKRSLLKALMKRQTGPLPRWSLLTRKCTGRTENGLKSWKRSITMRKATTKNSRPARKKSWTKKRGTNG